MVVAGDIRKGTTFELEGKVYTVVEFMHVKPGKGAAFVRTKLKDVMTGGAVEKTFNPSEKLESAVIETREMQYSYNDGEFYYFMDNETYEQVPLTEEEVGDALKYMKEEMDMTIRFYKGKAFNVQAPNFVVLEVTETEPGFKGDTATSGTKPATVETGAVVQVPLFVNEGDKIRIDTRTDEYMERA
ncbi:MAG: elongation factor P [Clostridia bacterium]|nr:elongation factor P [Clostridia bacterium]